MSIQALIFDLGGVLVRTEDPTPRTALAERLGISRAELEFIVFSKDSGSRAQAGEVDALTHWELVRQAFNLSGAQLVTFQNDFWGGDRLDGELVDFIRRLRPRYKTALLSNAFSDLRQLLEQRWQIAGIFDEIVISSEVRLVKPDARVYQLVLQRLGVQPQEAVFVDDFADNIEGARRVGLHTVHFRSAAQARQELDTLLAA